MLGQLLPYVLADLKWPDPHEGDLKSTFLQKIQMLILQFFNGDKIKARSDTLISGIASSQALVNRSRKLLIELSDTLEHSRRLIDESYSIIAKPWLSGYSKMLLSESRIMQVVRSNRGWLIG